MPGSGYPDHGNGLYADLLEYKDWFEFNLDQRVHKNFLENVTMFCFNAIVLGVWWPITALVLASIQFVGRIIYSVGYR